MNLLQVGQASQPASSRGILAPWFWRQDAAQTGSQDVCPTGSWKASPAQPCAFGYIDACELPTEPHKARSKTSVISSLVRAIGLPFMLLDLAASSHNC